MRLVGKEIPGWVNRMANIGSYFSCLLPDQTANSAPVDANTSSASSSSSSYSNSYSNAGYSRVSQSSASAPMSSFSGAGRKLGNKYRQHSLFVFISIDQLTPFLSLFLSITISISVGSSGDSSSLEGPSNNVGLHVILAVAHPLDDACSLAL